MSGTRCTRTIRFQGERKRSSAMAVKEKQPIHSTILLDRRSKRAAAFADLQPRVITSVTDIRDSVAHASKDSVWISYASDLTEALVKRAFAAPATLGMGVFIHELDMRTITVLSSLFRRIAFAVDDGFIPAE